MSFLLFVALLSRSPFVIVAFYAVRWEQTQTINTIFYVEKKKYRRRRWRDGKRERERERSKGKEGETSSAVNNIAFHFGSPFANAENN